ncbi:tRNA pseudouridine(55) synthase TruB [Bifidobacterium sp. SMB2]|uniref:tRNA pseudouridine synthase B n=1 Tax=Bifidobacterium saimiriisciurei TaxID=2661627 RepID=A0ABX0CHC8_9BIFI|nr:MULTISPECIES: tRNA pseudouridine(55) synthase TruB [Bifidobacterium]NEG96669.1 tRNA pseudouridine(55) synthase TruB [Bifidobacterium sp. SMB2]NEH11825.1 tRNA pseudouridine(55) synthase TruB [Bifidobacterium saimiriisciurei]
MPTSSESGILVVDKPQGVTSHDVVAAVRSGLRMKRVGHAGTLDPMATGVLVVGFGNATRLLNYIVGADKTYEATIRLGQFTTTDDADGDIIPWMEKLAHGGFSPDIRPDAHISGDITDVRSASETLKALDRSRIEQAIAEHFTGRIEQTPTVFSAIKIDGKRAYDLAREGKDVKLEARPITISEFTVLTPDIAVTNAADTDTNADDDDSADTVAAGESADGHNATPIIDVTVRVTCSSGTYIRALARDLGYVLGVGGHLTMLRRTRVGEFDLGTTERFRAVTAHTESRTFTNRDGETITRNRCTLDYPEPDENNTEAAAKPADETREQHRAYLLSCALSMPESARRTMPCVDVTADEARELRFGRWIARRGDGLAAAIHGDDLVAIIQPANRRQAKPAVVFPAE